MSVRIPWAAHTFAATRLEPDSCLKCGRPEADPLHVSGATPEADGPLVEIPPVLLADSPPPLLGMPARLAGQRRRMPIERQSLTHKAVIYSNEGTFEMYITAGMYEDGSLGEIFVRGIGKEGSTTQGLLDAFAAMWSIAMQHGASLDSIARKFTDVKFAPYGTTENPEIERCTSLIDYICQWLTLRFGQGVKDDGR